MNQRSLTHRQLIVDALAARYGGTAYAAIQVARHLARDPALDEVLVLTRSGSIVAEGISDQPGLRVLKLPQARRVELVRRLAWEALVLPRLVHEKEASLLTWSGMLPRQIRGPVTCYLANPTMFQSRGVANRIRTWAAARTARAATHVLVPTHAMAALASPAIASEIEVLPLGVDHAHFVPTSAPGNDVLCVADFYPHKRHDLVLDAWSALPEPRPVLRLVGDSRVNEVQYQRVCKLVERYRRLGTIIINSRLSLRELVDSYHRARVFILASEQESFALPLLEAQACGVPAVVRDLSVLHETGGDATTYVRGTATQSWTAALDCLLHDDDLHANARTAAISHARSFSWERTASELRMRLAYE